MADGGVKININLDSSKAVKGANEFTSTVKNLGKEIDKSLGKKNSASAFEKDLSRIKGEINDTKKALDELNRAKTSKNSALKEAKNDVNEWKKALNEANKIYDKTLSDSKKRGSGVTKRDVRQRNLDTQYAAEQLGKAEDRAEALRNEIKSVDSAIDSTKQRLSGLSEEQRAVGTAAKEAAAEEKAAAKEAIKATQERRQHILNLAKSIGGALVSSIKSAVSIVGKIGTGLGKGIIGLNAGGVKAITGIVKGVGRLVGAIKGLLNPLTKIFARVGTMIKYRVVRKVMSDLFSGLTEGIGNLAKYSDSANAAMTSITASSTYLKNSLAAMVAPALNVIANAFYSIANAAARAMEAISRFIALIGGRSSYIKATRYAQDYADSLSSAGGGAKKLEAALLGIDEINKLNDSSGGGGGGGSGIGAGDMFETDTIEETLSDMFNLGQRFANTIADSLNSIPWDTFSSKIKQVGSNLVNWINGAISVEELATAIGGTIGEAINLIADAKIMLDYDVNWSGLGTRLGELINTGIKKIDAVKLGRALLGRLQAVVNLTANLLTTINFAQFGTKLSELVTSVVTQMFGSTDAEGGENTGIAAKIATSVSALISGALTVANIVLDTEAIQHIGEGVRNALVDAIKKMVNDDGTPAQFGAVVGKLISTAYTNLTGFLDVPEEDRKTIAKAIATAINSALATVNEHVDPQVIWDIIIGGINMLTQTLQGVNQEDINELVGKAITTALNNIPTLVGALTELATTIWNAIITAIKDWWNDGTNRESFWNALKELISSDAFEIVLTIGGIKLAGKIGKLLGEKALLKWLLGGKGGAGAGGANAVAGAGLNGVGGVANTLSNLFLSVAGATGTFFSAQGLLKLAGKAINKNADFIAKTISASDNLLEKIGIKPKLPESDEHGLTDKEKERELSKGLENLDLSSVPSAFQQYWDTRFRRNNGKLFSSIETIEATDTTPEDIKAVRAAGAEAKKIYEQVVSQRAREGITIVTDSKAITIDAKDVEVQEKRTGVGRSDVISKEEQFKNTTTYKLTAAILKDMFESSEGVRENMEAVANTDYTSIGNGTTGLERFGAAIRGVIDSISGNKTLNLTTIGFGTNIAQYVKNAFGGIIDGINNGFSGVNAIIERIKGNSILNGIFPNLFKLPKVPALAQGAVIPANREFLAVLGDQKSGTNIEAPLDTIVAAVMQALNTSGMNANAIGSAVRAGMSGLALKVDGSTIGRVVAQNINSNRAAEGLMPLNL